MLRAVDDAHAVVTQEHAITLNQKAATALYPLFTTRSVDLGQMKPWQARQVMMNQMQIQIEKQPAP